MPVLVFETFIDAPGEVCFDLMRDVRLHAETTAQTHETAGSRATDGKIALGQTVTFEGRNFGMRQRLTVKVVEFDRPRLFVDEMIEGRFKAFRHVHEFRPSNGGTIMKDTLTWTSPLGVIGRLFDSIMLKRHLLTLVTTRNARLKVIAERDHRNRSAV